MKKHGFLLSFLAGICLAGAADGVPGKVVADRLNLRFAPELKSPVAGKVVKDTALTVYSVRGNWAEVGAPENLKVYISEAYVSGGKVIRAVQMRSDKSATAPSFGELPEGSEVKLLDDRAYGWVRIEAPENLRLFAARMYLDFDAAELAKIRSAAAPKPEEKQTEAPVASEEKKEAEKAAPETSGAPAPGEEKK